MSNLNLKSKTDTSILEIEGYAATWDTPNARNVIFKRGCFRESLERLSNEGYLLPNEAYNSNPVGYITDAKEDSVGLWVKCGLYDTDLSRDVYSIAVTKKQYNKTQFLGAIYLPEVSSPGKRAGQTIVTKAELFLVYLSNAPVDVGAVVTGVKSLNVDAKANYTTDRATPIQNAQHYASQGRPGRPLGSITNPGKHQFNPMTAGSITGIWMSRKDPTALAGPQLFTNIIGSDNVIAVQLWKTTDTQRFMRDVVSKKLPAPSEVAGLVQYDEFNSMSCLWQKEDLVFIQSYLVENFLQTFELHDEPVFDMRSVMGDEF